MTFLGINLSPNFIQWTRSVRAVGALATAAGVAVAKIAAIQHIIPALAPLGPPVAVAGILTASVASFAHDVLNFLTSNGLDTQGPK